MDPITTGIGGALIAKALPEERRGPIGVWVMTGAALFPDLDIFAAQLTGDPMVTLTFHRGYTHSFLGVLTLAPLLALAARATGFDKNYKRLLGLCSLALLWHIFTDVPTTWGTIVFWPFNWTRVAWDWIFIIDFYYTGLLLAPQLVAWVYFRREGRQRLAASWRGVLLWFAMSGTTYWGMTLASRSLNQPISFWIYLAVGTAFAAILILPSIRGWGFRAPRATFARIGLAAFALYVGVAAVSHSIALSRVERLATRDSIEATKLAALPQPLSPFRWGGMALTEEGVYRNSFNLFDENEPEWSLFETEENDFVERARAVPEVQTYLWFTRFPVARYHNSEGDNGEQHVVEFAAMRFTLGGPVDRRTRSRFGFRVVFDSNGEVVSAGFPGRR